jgi:hypothetical protein
LVLATELDYYCSQAILNSEAEVYMHSRLCIVIAFAGSSLVAHAQWLNHPVSGTPRMRDGKPNLSAPAPHAANGKPELGGVWQAEGSPIPELINLLPGGQNGLGEDIPTKYFLNVLADFKPGEEPLQPMARLRSASLTLTSLSKDDIGLNCLPAGMPMIDTAPGPFKIVQTSGVILMLSEADTTFRQIFTDGRKLPDDPQPSWMGNSVGRWEGNTLVVETSGFNDRGKLDALGHGHSSALRITERFLRRDFGHMELQMTLDDPQTFTHPVTMRIPLRLLPDTDLIESFCSENEKDLPHILAGNAVR